MKMESVKDLGDGFSVMEKSKKVLSVMVFRMVELDGFVKMDTSS